MKILSSMRISHGNDERIIELLQGDLAHIPPEHSVDIVVVSSFPAEYRPTPNSLIGALHRRGISVDSLSREPDLDLRSSLSCWLSRSLGNRGTAGFDRILCFETSERGRPPELVGDVFRCLAPLVYAPPHIKSVAMPILSSGEQGYPVQDMMPAMLDAAIGSLKSGLALEKIKIVVKDPYVSADAVAIFNDKRQHFEHPLQEIDEAENYRDNYDVFISYQRKDENEAEYLGQILSRAGLRVFLDTCNIDTGSAWQREIFEAIESSSKFIVLLSPEYIMSKVCNEEFSAAMIINRERNEKFIFPILLRDMKLPVYIRMYNFKDCRINDKAKIDSAASKLISTLLDRGRQMEM